jgi:dTDP-glucose 4,6-dehydratase
MESLVTGGAGFIGSHLCERLLEEGHEVICLDNFLTGKKENIEPLLINEKFFLIEEDVTKFPLSRLTSPISLIFHLASPASPVDYQKYPIKTLMANSLGTDKMLRLARKKKAKFLLASSSEVYGDPLKHPQKEDYFGHVNPIGPRACYDEAKRFAEALTMSFYRRYDLDVRIARIFNTYGPRMRVDDGRVISSFINQALQNKAMTVFGKGTQTRSFCYIEDMVEGLLVAMMKDKTSGEVFNLGSNSEIRIIKLARTIKTLTKSRSKLKFTQLPEDDPRRRKPDISKAKKILKWQPKIGLKKGLLKTIEYYQGQA